jgi:hypothetical protein
LALRAACSMLFKIVMAVLVIIEDTGIVVRMESS